MKTIIFALASFLAISEVETAKGPKPIEPASVDSAPSVESVDSLPSVDSV